MTEGTHHEASVLRLNIAVNASLRNDVGKISKQSFKRIIHQQDFYLHTGELIYRLPHL